MIIIHGDNISKSRQKLTETVAAFKNENKEILTLTGKNLTAAALEEALGETSLFGTDRVVVIEELHSLPESAKKKQLIATLAAADQELVLWEKRLLTATMLKKFPQAQVEIFKASSLLFQWLDMLGVSKDKKRLLSDLHQIIKDESAFFCFTMLIRQVRMLIAALDDGQVKGPPFMVSKLKTQARSFSLDQLLTVHTKLLEIDYKQKRSLSRLSLEQELDLLVLSL